MLLFWQRGKKEMKSTLQKIGIAVVFLALTAGFSLYFWKEFVVNGNNSDPLNDVNRALVDNSVDQSLKSSAQGTAAQQNPNVNPAANQSAAAMNQMSADNSIAANQAQTETDKTPADASKETSQNSGNPYESKSLGISLKIPDGFKTDEKSGRLTISKDGKKISIKVYNNKDKSEIEDWFKNQFDQTANASCSWSSSDVKIGSLDTKEAPENDANCQDGGLVALSSDKAKVVKADTADKNDSDIKNILSSIVFN